MRSRRYLLTVVGTTAAVAVGAGVAAAAPGSKTTSSKPATPRSHSTRRYAPRSGGNCPNMGGSAQGSAHSSGTAGPAVSSYNNI